VIHRLCLLLLLTLMPTSVFAQSRMPIPPLAYTQLEDPAQEQAAKALMETIRCVVCQGQSVADSDAETAADMRALIRQRIKEGEKPDAIRVWLIERYGAYITYDPPFTGSTALLWFAPILLLLAGFGLMRGRIKRRRAT
jgi:cytochrome c-type biogenesis protein CcmH